jgi:hypothetical protein
LPVAFVDFLWRESDLLSNLTGGQFVCAPVELTVTSVMQRADCRVTFSKIAFANTVTPSSNGGEMTQFRISLRYRNDVAQPTLAFADNWQHRKSTINSN